MADDEGVRGLVGESHTVWTCTLGCVTAPLLYVTGAVHSHTWLLEQNSISQASAMTSGASPSLFARRACADCPS